MQEQCVDEGPGAVAVPEAPAGFGPQSFVGGPEGPAGSGPGQGSRAEERPGLDGENLEVVIEDQDLVALQTAGMAGGDGSAVEDLDGLGADADIDTPADETGGDRVVTAPDHDSALAVDAVRADHGDVEPLARQRPQRVGFEGEVLSDGGEPHHEQRHLRQQPAQVDADRPEVDFALLAEHMGLRDHHLDERDLRAATDLGDEPADRRLADLSAVFLDEALPHPPCRVPLLARRQPVRLEPLLDRRLPRIELRGRPLRPLALGRHRRGRARRTSRRWTRNRRDKLVDRQPVIPSRAPDVLVELHPRPRRHDPTVGDDGQPQVDPQGGAKSDEHYPPKWGQLRGAHPLVSSPIPTCASVAR